MTTKDIMKLIVKALGLIVFLYGLEAVLEGLLGALGLSDPRYAMPQYWGARGAVEVVFGLLVMRGTIPLVELALPEDYSDEPPPEGPAENERPSK